MITEMPVNLDWTQDPTPPHLTPHQKFMREFDWSKTAFGPIESWSRELRQSARFMLAETAPGVLIWGSSYMTMWNEAYAPLIGGKHPDGMGLTATEIFPDFWEDYFGGVIHEMGQTGQTATGDATRLLMERHGYLEETFFTWKLVPVIGDEGTMLGIYGTAEDKTTDAIGERRALCVQDLAQRVAQCNSLTDMWQSTVEGLATNPMDIPFALLYCDVQSLKSGTPPLCRNFEVVGSVAAPRDDPLLCKSVDVDADIHGFSSAIREAIGHMRTVVVTSDDAKIAGLLDDVQWQGSGIPCQQFAVVPIAVNSTALAALVVGINPHRRYNSWYQQFLGMVSDVLQASMSRIRISEELKYRSEIATRTARDYHKMEKRFSRFAARSTAGFAITDLFGNVSTIDSSRECLANIIRFFSRVTPGTNSTGSITTQKLQHGATMSSRKIFLSWENGGTKSRY